MSYLNDLPVVYEYTAAPGQTEFSFLCRAFSADSMFVSVDGEPVTHTADPQDSGSFKLVTDYAQEGGQVVFGAPLVGGETVTIRRRIPTTRATAYPNSGPVPMGTINLETDRHVGILQDLAADTRELREAPWPAAENPPTTAIEHGDLKLSEWLDQFVSALEFAADPTGTRNSTAALIAADAAAAAAGKSLFLPSGTYLIDPLTALASWHGQPGTVLKYAGTAQAGALVTSAGVDGVRFEGLTFDGSASADPSDWLLGYAAFTGASGLSVNTSLSPRVVNCHARNMRHHGFRFVECEGAVWESCTARRLRGNFGDGFIAISCVGVSFANCLAEDFTRIGFVADSFGETLGAKRTCHKVTVSNCFARNGHHASSLYDGGEFNAGYWFENVAEVSIAGSFASSFGDYGFNVCSGVRSAGVVPRIAVLTLTNCHADGGEIGFHTHSLDAFPVAARLVGCSAAAVAQGFNALARSETDSFTWTACHADYDVTRAPGNARGFSVEVVGALAGKPCFTLDACTVDRTSENPAALADETDSVAVADVGSSVFIESAVTLTVRALRHVAAVRPVYIKLPIPFAHDLEIAGTAFHLTRFGSDGGQLVVHANSTIHSMVGSAAEAARVRVLGSVILGDVVVQGREVDIQDNTITIEDDGKLWLLSAATGAFPALRVAGNRFAKDVGVDGPVLRLGFGTVAFTALLTDNTFYNSGAATASPFVHYATGSLRHWAGNFADASVSNISGLDSGGELQATVAGVTSVTMH